MSPKELFLARTKLWITLAAMCGALLLSMEIGGMLSWATEPPNREQIKAFERAGELKSRADYVRKLGNHRVDGFLLKRAIINQQRKFLQDQGKTRDEIDRFSPMLAPPPNWLGMPSTGTIKILTILIEFKDFTHTNSRDDVHSNLFGAGDPTRAPYESLAKYYGRASYGKLNLNNGTTLGWYRTAYDRSSVDQTDTGRENLIKEALNFYKKQGHDFSQYDSNKDGIIDYLIVIWTGPDNGWGSFWWGYQTTFNDPNYELDGVRLGKYSWQWEANPIDNPNYKFTPRTVIHETGHALGVPDYYHYDSAPGPQGGVGTLDIMDGNKGDHNCFSKWMLEWVEPKVVSRGTQTITLSASGNSQDCVIIWPGIATGDLFSEFFVAQNRNREGNDHTTEMPGDGMLIWHVDASLKPDGKDFEYDNSYTRHKLLRLMEADDKENIEKGNSVDSGVYYVSGEQFGPTTAPSSKKYDGKDSGAEVMNISAAGPQMAATFRIIRNP